MPLLRQGVLLPVKGVDFSQPSTFLDARNGFPTNFRYDKSVLKKRPGKTVQGGVVSGTVSQIMGLGKLELNNGSKFLVRASKTALERFVTASSTWASIASTPFSGGNDDFFSFATVTEDGLLAISNGIDRIRKWPGSGNNALLGGTPPIAKSLVYHTPYLLLADTDDGVSRQPWRINWSDTNNPEEWVAGNSGEALLSRDPSIIQAIANLNDFVAVYKKEALWLGRKVDPPDIFVFEPIKTGIGLAAPRAFAEAEGSHYFMGANDFFVWNGVQVDSIGQPVRDEVFSRINREKINRCFAVHVQEQQEIWFFIVVAGFDHPREVWKYNYRLGYWFFDTCESLTSAIKWERVNTIAWDDTVGSWDAYQGVWDASATVANWEEIVFGGADGFTSTLDYTTTNDRGVAVSSHFVTKDFVPDALELSARWLQFDVWAKGPGKLFADYSDDFGDTWTNIPYTPSTAYVDLDGAMRKYEFYLDDWAPQVRFRLRNAELGEVVHIQSLYPYYVAREEVRTYR